MLDIAQRFWNKVDPCRSDGCATWLGAHNPNGYGVFWMDGRLAKAHHFLVGRPPTGMEWDHVRERGCTNKDCIWPEHLELVTHAENVRRGNSGIWSRSKTHCPQGHPYSGDNVFSYSQRNERKCRICQAAHMAKSKRKAAAQRLFAALGY